MPDPGVSAADLIGAAIRTRRTHKVYGADPVPRETLEELFELARWAPNHHLTEPWRFRVLGPRSRAALQDAAGAAEATKLDRAPTLVVASVTQDGAPEQRFEDVCAGACAVYIVLLAAHARGLASYWRTPAVLRRAAGRAAAAVGDGELPLGLIHLGGLRQEREAPPRRETAAVVSYLD